VDSEGDSQNGGAENRDAATRRGSKWWFLLLLLPYVGLLYPPIYARLEPALWGIPFFIWYQFLWVFITVGITAFVYRVRG
jgi:Protein of unknown function (DUF3311)